MMKSLKLVMIFCFACSLLSAQSISNLRDDFLISFYDAKRDSSAPFLYTKHIHLYHKAELIGELKKGRTLREWKIVKGNNIMVDSVVLTSEEQSILIKQFQIQTDSSLWNEIPFPFASSIVSRDTLDAIFKDRNKGWLYFYSNYGRRFHSFTIPIFFRNNTLCAFYYDTSCGYTCGEGVFAIYRNVKRNWIKAATVLEWVS